MMETKKSRLNRKFLQEWIDILVKRDISPVEYHYDAFLLDKILAFNTEKVGE